MASLKIDTAKFLSFTRLMPLDEIGMFITVTALITENGSITHDELMKVTTNKMPAFIAKAFDCADGIYTRKQHTPKKPKQPPKQAVLFRDSPYYSKAAFCNAFSGTDYAGFNLSYYYESVLNWSDSKAEKRSDWIATARGFMARDAKDGKAAMAGVDLLKTNNNGPGNSTMASRMAAQFSAVTNNSK